MSAVHPSSDAPSSPTRPVTALRQLRPDIIAMAPYTPGEQVRDCTKLNTNECAWGPSPAVLAALRACGDDSLRLYPDPVSLKLRQAAAERYGVRAEQVLAGNGSDDCLTIIYRAFLAPGDRVACPWPTYGLYDTLAALQGVEIVHVDYRQDAAGWHLPANLARQAAKLVLVANPNNPSATLTPVTELRRLADQLDGVLVVDEAYIDFAGAGASLLPHLDQHPNLIVLRTFSKSYSLAGARLGLLFAHADLVAHLTKVKDSYNVNAVTQAMGVAALGDVDHHRELVRKTLAERARIETAFAAFGWTWPPSAGNFLLCEIGARAGELYRGLKQRGILVRWWDRPALRSRLRITVGRPEQGDALLAALRELGA
ncbi:MAG: histidinol-phosphate transaminase [Planctomycetes bacterium]|nr:histidinol-phosphate transaminase [Planctomycetota bacterium]